MLEVKYKCNKDLCSSSSMKIKSINDIKGVMLQAVLVVPKWDDDVRVCIDMRYSNEAVTLTRYPTPTVDDLLVSLRGSKVFTKHDRSQ